MLTVREIRSVKLAGDMHVIQIVYFQSGCTTKQIYKVKY
jgi:hypothetical protein